MYFDMFILLVFPSSIILDKNVIENRSVSMYTETNMIYNFKNILLDDITSTQVR